MNSLHDSVSSHIFTTKVSPADMTQGTSEPITTLISHTHRLEGKNELHGHKVNGNYHFTYFQHPQLLFFTGLIIDDV